MPVGETMSLAATAAALAAPGKGLLASDESTGTIGRRLEGAGFKNTAEERRAYRELFYTAPLGGAGISGAILFSEALCQKAGDGTPFVECLERQGVLPGVKVDEGLVPLESSPGETRTLGLAGLEASAARFRAGGARFAKWRAALTVGGACPSAAAVERNARDLAAFAVTCQAAGLVPIVEPELLIDGGHSAAEFEAATARVLSRCVAALWAANAELEGLLLKPQMVVPGADWGGARPAPEETAHRTLAVLRRCVPPAIPGIMFLSGGQSEEEATVNLNAINLASGGQAPWALSFSYGRALQASVLQLWSEDRSDPGRCRDMAAALARVNGLAALGQYSGPHPSVTSHRGSLRESFRGWRTDVPPEGQLPS